MALQQIRDSLPKYRYLTPGVDMWREEDEVLYYWFDNSIEEIANKWLKADYLVFGKVLRSSQGRRPIPDEVLDNQAFWVLYNKLATVDPIPQFDQAFSQFIITLIGEDEKFLDVEEEAQFNGMRGFNGSSMAYSAIPLLGGEQNIIKHLSAGDLYSKWLSDQTIKE